MDWLEEQRTNLLVRAANAGIPERHQEAMVNWAIQTSKKLQYHPEAIFDVGVHLLNGIK